MNTPSHPKCLHDSVRRNLHILWWISGTSNFYHNNHIQLTMNFENYAMRPTHTAKLLYMPRVKYIGTKCTRTRMCSGNTTNVKLGLRRHLSAIVTASFTNVPETFSGSSTLSSDATDSSSDSLSTGIKQAAIQKNIQTRTPCIGIVSTEIDQCEHFHAAPSKLNEAPLPVLVSVIEILLPAANEVWGKVIFSHACVSHSVHWGGGVSLSCHFLSGCLIQRRGGCLCPGGLRPERSLLGDPLRNQKSGQYASYSNAFLFNS